jgi:hypothetical protein
MRRKDCPRLIEVGVPVGNSAIAKEIATPPKENDLVLDAGRSVD